MGSADSKSDHRRPLPFTKSRWYQILIIFLIQVVLTIGAISFAVWLDRRNAQRWCDVVITLDRAYRATPPQTDTGRKLASDIARLRADLSC